MSPPDGWRPVAFRSAQEQKSLAKDGTLRYIRDALIPVADRLSSILPKGAADAAVHRGARRRCRRWALDAEIDLLTPARGSGLAINASIGGLRVAVDTGVPVDQICTLRVRTAPDHETIEHAKVVWSKTQPDGYVLGLEFIAAPLA